MGARLGDALKRLVVDANDPETLGVAERPLEVVEKTPHEVPVDRHACIDGVAHVPYVLTDGNGDPGGASLFYTMYFFRQTFNFYNGGYGATLAWTMFLVIMSITAFVFWSAKHWHYQYEARR